MSADNLSTVETDNFVTGIIIWSASCQTVVHPRQDFLLSSVVDEIETIR